MLIPKAKRAHVVLLKGPLESVYTVNSSMWLPRLAEEPKKIWNCGLVAHNCNPSILLSIEGTLRSIPTPYKLGKAGTPSTWKVEAGVPGGQSHPQLHCEASLGYMRPNLKRKEEEEKEEREEEEGEEKEKEEEGKGKKKRRGAGGDRERAERGIHLRINGQKCGEGLASCFEMQFAEEHQFTCLVLRVEGVVKHAKLQNCSCSWAPNAF